MTKLDGLVLALQEVSLPGDLPGECDLGQGLKKFFSKEEIKAVMIKMNQSQLYDQQESRYGTRLGVYAEKTAKHKRRVGLPDKYYTYYETGATHESLDVLAEDDWVMVTPGEDAPEYANFALDTNAWGLNDENFEELMPEIKGAVVEQIRDFLRNG